MKFITQALRDELIAEALNHNQPFRAHLIASAAFESIVDFFATEASDNDVDFADALVETTWLVETLLWPWLAIIKPGHERRVHDLMIEAFRLRFDTSARALASVNEQPDIRALTTFLHSKQK